MTLLSRLVPPFIMDHAAINRRLTHLETSNRCLEMALDAILVRPKYVPSADTGFNGQACRKRIFDDILRVAPVQAIAETGTCLGDTTGYMAQTSQLPVHTCEVSPRFHALATSRLSEIDDIHLNLEDSRTFLRESAHGPLIDKFIFFYLDAHWYDEVPLSRELEIIVTEWKHFIVMVDDFQVPDDAGYGYDYYDGTALTLGLIGSLIKQHDLVPFFPSFAAAQETGAKRGSVVLARKGENADQLASLSTLRMWPVQTEGANLSTAHAFARRFGT